MNISPPLDLLLAANSIAGVRKIQLRGRSTALSNSAETIWTQAAGTYAQLTTGTALEVVSGSVNDAAAGTGARTVRVKYLDADYTEASQDVTLNGTTPVALTDTTVVAVNSVEVLTAGSGGTNAGNIDVRTVVGSTAKARISSNARALGVSWDFIYTVPANHVGLLMDVDFSLITSTGDISVYIQTASSTGVVKVVGLGQCSMSNTGFAEGKGKIPFGRGLVIPEKTLIEGRGIASAGTPDISAQADLYLFDCASDALKWVPLV